MVETNVKIDVRLPTLSLVFNFWEEPTAHIGFKLDALLSEGFHELVTFLPWQLIESDASHVLVQFLQHVSDRKMEVFLIMTPEVGIHYPHAGIPSSWFASCDELAQNERGEKIPVLLPPKCFYLPSLFSPNLLKRYYHYLSKLHHFFSHLSSSISQCFVLVLTGSFWKYYRSTESWMQVGDYSSHADFAFRQRVDSFYSQKEFLESPVAKNYHWKSKILEPINRQWFYQLSEEVFRSRSRFSLQRRSVVENTSRPVDLWFDSVQEAKQNLPVLDLELLTPEAAPGFLYSKFLQILSQGSVALRPLSEILDDWAMRGACLNKNPLAFYIYWTSTGEFTNLSLPEKEFLLFKSLLIVGFKKNGIFLEFTDWLHFPSHLKNKLKKMISFFNEESQKLLSLRSQVLYLTLNVWSQDSLMLNTLKEKVPYRMQVISNFDGVLSEYLNQVLIVDPDYIFTSQLVHKLISWVRSGRTVVLPHHSLYTKLSQNDLSDALKGAKKSQFNFNIPYDLFDIDSGKLIVYDLKDYFSVFECRKIRLNLNSESFQKKVRLMQDFLDSIFLISDFEKIFSIKTESDLDRSLISLIPYCLDRDCRQMNQFDLNLFIFNESHKAIRFKCFFYSDVKLFDLNAFFFEDALNQESLISPCEEVLTQSEFKSHYLFEIKPYSLLCVGAQGVDLIKIKENQLAAIDSAQNLKSALSVASTELSGLDEVDLNSLWN